ncbi:hypothetical protein BDQ94DRAFT_143150 [Aspergillus welwitschiae]|uniref:Uncharacterized protein n=1 Tax=Aspergillus welwitschiae TaxID=1341132 RepID=A0A3F3Q2K4_9EURO|nr:hypothetical protein BDQ94DRAFT_143150 [Aspergillus welwitschiae]RDH33454.1 hypothetical protein BDQ94DRAFT_143150 [Aspergillus welwitschiae]
MKTSSMYVRMFKLVHHVRSMKALPRQGLSPLFGVVSGVQVPAARAKCTRRVPKDRTERQPGYPSFRCKVGADD